LEGEREARSVLHCIKTEKEKGKKRPVFINEGKNKKQEWGGGKSGKIGSNKQVVEELEGETSGGNSHQASTEGCGELSKAEEAQQTQTNNKT